MLKLNFFVANASVNIQLQHILVNIFFTKTLRLG